jgi:hypothetical protein
MSDDAAKAAEVEVTPEMIEAAMPHAMRIDTGSTTDADFAEILTDIYCAMLAAAPQTTQQNYTLSRLPVSAI